MTGFFKDLFRGNFTGVWQDVVSAFRRLPSWIQLLITKAETQEATILNGLVATATTLLMADLANPSQITTTAIVAQAKGIYQQLISQNISTFTLQDVFSLLNASLSAQTPPSNAAPVNQEPSAPVAPEAIPATDAQAVS